MESSANVFGLSFGKNPRRGQLAVFNHPKLLTSNRLNIKLPTGYGKTFTACGVYSILKKKTRVNRILWICPFTSQLEQFIKDAPEEMRDAAMSGPRKVMDVGFFSTSDLIKNHRQGTCEIFVVTIQALSNPTARDRVTKLLGTGQWMIVVDEYHHYGTEKVWGTTVSSLSRAFLLAMSATPYRPTEDSAFGKPDISITYREAYKDGAVKKLKGHAYDYKIDAIDEDGNLVTYTTNELIREAGDDSPERIEKFRIARKMRWSPKYVSPLLRIPIMRMMDERGVVKGIPRLQVLISAMCVSHAELICIQLRSMYADLKVDWVGTGNDGRSIEDNKRILDEFCPQKKNGIRSPTLDVLVHVGMAGEGLDATNISEVILLRSATLCNQVVQIIGRASRILNEGEVTANINFDRSTELASPPKKNNAPRGYVGESIMDAMDLLPPSVEDDDDQNNENEDEEWPDLPEEPPISIVDINLIGIDSGDERIQRMANILEAAKFPDVNFAALRNNLEDPGWQTIIKMYRQMETVEAREFDEKSIIAQWRSSVDSLLSRATGVVIRLMSKPGVRIEKSVPGDIKKRINRQKKIECGEIANDVETCRRHYQWLNNLYNILRQTKTVPQWLS